jgi:hypothetical protein
MALLLELRIGFDVVVEKGIKFLGVLLKEESAGVTPEPVKPGDDFGDLLGGQKRGGFEGVDTYSRLGVDIEDRLTFLGRPVLTLPSLGGNLTPGDDGVDRATDHHIESVIVINALMLVDGPVGERIAMRKVLRKGLPLVVGDLRIPEKDVCCHIVCVFYCFHL